MLSTLEPKRTTFWERAPSTQQPLLPTHQPSWPFFHNRASQCHLWVSQFGENRLLCIESLIWKQCLKEFKHCQVFLSSLSAFLMEVVVPWTPRQTWQARQSNQLSSSQLFATRLLLQGSRVKRQKFLTLQEVAHDGHSNKGYLSK